jgi:hypothetical protein
MRRTRLCVAAVVFVGALAGCGGGSEGVSGGASACDRSSTAIKRAWADAVAADDERARFALADYVVKCRTLVGQPRRAVTALLGEPSRTYAHGMDFLLGPDSLGIDAMQLSVLLDSSDMVKSVQVVQT